ncbi:hypothetical protein BCD67_17540 [Oscillatoriales cyanobacterium USR001]|nr:hypothetical protein BCD67_17540 [Oscillatoriales cyanobacterium USR001]
MGKKSLKVTVHGLSDENYADVAHGIVKTVKAVAPNSDISILGATPETFEGSSNKEIKGR